MNNQVLFKRISGVNFAKLSSSYTTGAMYFIVSTPSTLSTVGNVKITKGQIWIAKSATEVELYTNGIKSATLVGNTITLEDNLGETTSINLAAFENSLKDYIDLKTTNVYRFIGSVNVENLNNLTAEHKHHGDVWNILDKGTLTIEGGDSVDVLLGDNVAWIIDTDTNKGKWDKLAGVVDISGKQNTLVNNDVITVVGDKLSVGVDGTHITKTENNKKLTLTTSAISSLGKADTAIQTITKGDGINAVKTGTGVKINAVAPKTASHSGENYVEVVSGGIQTTADLETRLKAVETSTFGGVQSVKQADASINVSPTSGDVKLKANYDNSGNIKFETTATGIKAELLWEEDLS